MSFAGQAVDEAIKSGSLKMDDRTCERAGCGINFRVWEKSPQVFCSTSCDIAATENPALRTKKKKALGYKGPRAIPDAVWNTKGNTICNTNFNVDKPVEIVEKTKKTVIEKVIESSTIEKRVPESKKEPAIAKSELEEAEARWLSYVERAKKFVKRMNRDRLDIAQLAIEACDIQLGGGNHWSGFKGVYTLKKFAEEVGITYKTLSNWVRVKRNVVDRLPEGYYDEESYFAANRVANETDRNTSPEEVKERFDKWKNKGTQGHQLLQLHRRVRSGAFFIHNRADMAELDVETLRELRDNCQSIANDINSFFKGSK